MKFNKPDFWDLKKNSFLSYIFFPFTFFIRLNNLIIKISKKEKTKKIFSICVGNIYVGGTGKTPTVIKLFNIIKKINNKVVTAKKDKLNQKDEILLLKKKTNLITGKNRKEVLFEAIKKKKKVIIFDGLQDKKIDYSLKFVCFDTLNWIGNGNLLPAGPLRQNLNVLKKFDVVFLKTIKKQENIIITKLKKVNPNIKIFMTRYVIKNKKKINLKEKYIVFSSIGNPKNFEILLNENKVKIIDHLIFPDHYLYSNNEIQKIIIKAKQKNYKILTTEKDYVKIQKIYKKHINCVEVDLRIKNEPRLIKYLKHKINA